RQAHNLKVVGSNPTPATKFQHNINALATLGWLSVFLAQGRWKHRGSNRGEVKGVVKLVGSVSHGCLRGVGWVLEINWVSDHTSRRDERQGL
ncbi:hypothetical protein, partial [Celeribacter halophilus]|uniref:hypothetical protein n=1 Tax=Celeribacter halophilus TaxID=576117 RepID=UPI002FCFEA91